MASIPSGAFMCHTVRAELERQRSYDNGNGNKHTTTSSYESSPPNSPSFIGSETSSVHSSSSLGLKDSLYNWIHNYAAGTPSTAVGSSSVSSSGIIPASASLSGAAADSSVGGAVTESAAWYRHPVTHSSSLPETVTSSGSSSGYASDSDASSGTSSATPTTAAAGEADMGTSSKITARATALL